MTKRSTHSVADISFAHQQKGTVTLVIALILLTSITFVTLYTSKSIITEQRLANNDYRSRMAFEAAEAGLAAAVTNLSLNIDLNANNVLDGSTSTEYLFDNNGDNVRESNAMSVGNASVTVVTQDVSAAGDNSLIRVTATGYSDDKTAKRVIKRVLARLAGC